MPELTPTELKAKLAAALPDALLEPEPIAISPPPKHGPFAALFTPPDPLVRPQRLVDAALFVRDTLGYAYLSDIAVVDYLYAGCFEIVYRFYHPAGGSSIVLRVRVPRDEPVVPSLTPYWPAAHFHEREAYDLFGIVFTGHPYLHRIYMWDEFEGFPMRKDFPRQGDKYLGAEE
ncbi:NADH-quinone oxidoreductase subunit C [Chloroflexus aggregans]|uniref:NADH dehydrogenase (Ubiquinone) 30 kDa subunit n=1 Tax=Chloroflexus aggregans (strain MD-66 / DSM 9485) TaxID=326427 RepID=B8GA15_CHLAD|nr:NADH-quinone oxidoreductase subunit C [Chloroflexus aggregans]ACL24530.1 NADH dehydrogenase (ubiquinone) 30 kDa subunit [Chloroflexus aggregans DSM 9485]